MTQPVFALHEVGLRLGAVQALQGVSLRIEAGERVALVGANGSGKSSLLRLLHGLLPPSSGHLSRPTGGRQAMLFQHPHMLRCSAQAHVALGLWLAGVPWSRARAQAAQALAQVGLAAQARRSARALSGGQQQRLALAQVWALQPDVLLLDEPGTGLDPAAQQALASLLQGFGRTPESDRTPPATLVFSSHDMAQVRHLASRVLYLHQGRLRADLPVGAFFNEPELHVLSAEGFFQKENRNE